MKAVCKFTFPKDTARELIEAAIASAIIQC
jgi:hypothetical protein